LCGGVRVEGRVGALGLLCDRGFAVRDGWPIRSLLCHPHCHSTTANGRLLQQDASKLQPGAFYLDRAPAAKHLTLSGTSYPDSKAAELVDKLLGMAGLS